MSLGGTAHLSRPTYPNDTVKFKPVSECKNIPNFLVDGSGCPQDKLVGVDGPVEDALAIVEREVANGDGAAYRKPPLVIDRLARGGKTTLLALLFERLKAAGFLPIIITFNISSDFSLLQHESRKQALLRYIAAEMLELRPNTHFQCDEDALIKHINTASQSKPVVLLIDELNKLVGTTGDEDVSSFLKTHFLVKGRYLVFNTHWPLDIDNPTPGELASKRGCRRLKLPRTMDLSVLRKMPGCEALTQMQAATYGGIPSLIFCAMRNEPSLDLDLVVNENADNYLKGFLKAVLFGAKSEYPALQRYATMESRSNEPVSIWPPFYIGKILKEIQVHTAYAAGKFLDDSLKIYAATTESGKDWEVIVHAALLLRCLHSKMSWEPLPLLQNVPNAELKSLQIRHIDIPEDYKAVDDSFHSFVLQKVANSEAPSASTVTLFTPVHSKFELFDGFLCYSKEKEIQEIVGIQCKAGEDQPNRDKRIFPDWIRQGYLIRGRAPDSAFVDSHRRWTFLDEDRQLREILGESLSALYPKAFPRVLS